MTKVTLKIRRSSPSEGRAAEYVEYVVPVQPKMTVLDAIAWAQRNVSHNLAYRYACRVGMCGTCAVVINGREGWACRTLVERLHAPVVTIEPLRNLPVIKDLVVDMQPFFATMMGAMGYFVADGAGCSTGGEPVIRMRDRTSIDPHIQCISCGACYSACTMVHWDPQYLGPAALNRAATLVMDSRDGARHARLDVLDSEHGCWRCHTQFSCTEVCPMQLNPTESIGYLKRQLVVRNVGALARAIVRAPEPEAALPAGPAAALEPPAPPPAMVADGGRRRVLEYGIAGVLSAIATSVAATAAAFLRGPSTAAGRPWISLGPVERFPLHAPAEAIVDVSGHADREASRRLRRVYVVRSTATEALVLSSECSHLGCGVHWDAGIGQFVCPCHGGTFDLQGRVTAGPPPRPLAAYRARVERGALLVQET
ncbi:MAG: Rieske 2Fe-2S domain-containing protein [Acidobacteria bacterium]|nr:Rieske 2Fe-2S domain-containing protein [Acidobacteriota bacterium]